VWVMSWQFIVTSLFEYLKHCSTIMLSPLDQRHSLSIVHLTMRTQNMCFSAQHGSAPTLH